MNTQISTISRDCVASRMTHNKYFTSQMRLTSSSYLPQPPCFRLIRIILRVKTGWLMLVLLNSNIEPLLARTQWLNVRQAKTIYIQNRLSAISCALYGQYSQIFSGCFRSQGRLLEALLSHNFDESILLFCYLMAFYNLVTMKQLKTY